MQRLIVILSSSKGSPEPVEGRKRASIIVALTAALITACTPQQQPPTTATATVNVDKLVSQHPFYPLLKHYDEQIAALRETETHTPINNTAMANDVHRLRSDLDTTAQALNALVDKQTQRYQQEEDAAVAQLQRTPRGKTAANADIAKTLLRNYHNQQTALRTNASRDMERYRRELLAEQNAAYAAYVRGVNGRISRAYAAREQEFRERESTLALELARKDTPKAIAPQLRLQTLKLDAQRRHATTAQLQQIDSRENSVVQAQRARDRAELAQYRAQLLAQAHKDVADAAVRMQTRALANFDARRNIYLSQTQAAQAKLPITTHRAPTNGTDLRTALQQWQDRERARYASDLRDTVAAFTQTDVVDRMRTIQQTDADAGSNTDAAIQSIEQERESLRVRIRQQVIALAREIASQRHLALVEHGTPAATDLTPDVSARLQTYAV